MPHRSATLILLGILAGCAAQKTAPPAPEAPTAIRPPAVFRNGAPGPAAERTRTGTYSYLRNGAEAAQIDPLLAIVEVRLPGLLTTVEDAADYLLRRSGYCLMEPASPAVGHLYRLPIPAVHRRLGPMSLREALLALGGQAYELVVDEVYREVGYRVVPAAPAGGAT